MIVQELNNDAPFSYETGALVKQNAGTSSIDVSLILEEPSSFCRCACEYNELVFADVDNNLSHRNDKTVFAWAKSDPSDTVTIVVEKDNVEIGGIEDIGGVISDLSDYYACIIDWKEVYNTQGLGSYRFKGTFVFSGNTYTKDTYIYKLMLYDEIVADGTVRIEWYDTGTILSNSLDFSKMQADFPDGFYQSIRIYGKLYTKVQKYQQDRYKDTFYNILQIQDKITQTCDLETKLLPMDVANLMTIQLPLANQVYITDCNLSNATRYVRESLIFSELKDKKVYDIAEKCKILLTFGDKKEDIIKNNY